MKYNFEFVNSKVLNLVLFFSIINYPILFIFQDGDLTDSGYQAINYRFFFESLQTEKFIDMIFLTRLIGAIWLKIFPFGILSLRLSLRK